MRVQAISKKDVHNMKARSRGPNSVIQGRHRGPGVQGCLGGSRALPGGVHGGFQGRWGHSGKNVKHRMRGGCRGSRGPGVSGGVQAISRVQVLGGNQKNAPELYA